MTTTFDRYLLFRFLSAFGILFVSSFGLYAVIDGFSNVDAFQKDAPGTTAVLAKMGKYYFFQSAAFLDMAGPILATIAVMVVFALLWKNSELHPILAAGVPAYRLVVPALIGMLLVNGVLIANQEFVFPRISHHLQAPREASDETAKDVEPTYDFATKIHITGRQLFLSDRKMTEPHFLLPSPLLTLEMTTVKAEEAVFHDKQGNRPAGWLLKKVSPAPGDLRLTPAGQKIVRRLKDSQQLFITTDVSFDQLYDRSRSFQYVSTPDLIHRIQNPAYGMISAQSQTMHLHSRLTRPLANLLSVLIAVPLILRRESRSLIGNMALCAALLGGVYLFAQGLQYLGSVNLIAADLAAWLPVILSGSMSAWLTGVAQT